MHQKKKASRAGREKGAPSTRPRREESESSPRSAAAFLRRATSLNPSVAIVLGSGFQGVLGALKADCKIPFADIPGCAEPGVGGHLGRFACGKLGGATVALLAGRTHYYEGRSMEQVTFMVRTMAEFGVQDIVLTNAAGGLNPRFKVGDLMRLTDHINFMGENPLRGPRDGERARFVDLTGAYDLMLGDLLDQAARRLRLRLRQGIYLAVSGPSYETPAEIRAFRKLGADAVGMSTVPEVIVARQCNLRVAAVSCITNLAAGMAQKPLSHEEVLETGQRVNEISTQLLIEFARLYGQEDSHPAD